jgi:heat shock protein HspQ
LPLPSYDPRCDGVEYPVNSAMASVRNEKNRLRGQIPVESTLISGAILSAKFAIGQVVKHRLFPFRGVIYDVDPEFNNTEEWYEAIPEHIRPRRDQPFYHLYAENDDGYYEAYVSEQNLLVDDTGLPVEHPSVDDNFGALDDGYYKLDPTQAH